MTLESFLEIVKSAIVGRDTSVVESEQAIAAATKAIEERAQADTAVVAESEAISAFRTLALGFTEDSTDSDLANLLAAANTVAVSRGTRLIEVSEANDAMATSIRETAEAQMAEEEYAAKVAEIKEAAPNLE